MSESAVEPVRERLDALYRAESGRIRATLTRLLGDFDLAEDGGACRVCCDAGAWLREGVPASLRAGLVSTGRFKAIDALRRRARSDAAQETGEVSAADLRPGRAQPIHLPRLARCRMSCFTLAVTKRSS